MLFNRPHNLKYVYLLFLLQGIISFPGSTVMAQNEYLATLDYNTLTVTRKANIPGVTRVVADKTTFDENGQRFFFRANASGIPPFNLYTIDAVSGATIYSPVCPSNNPSGHVGGLQYDDAVDTLYAIYSDNNGSGWFSWIDPVTGAAHLINSIPSFSYYVESAFDKKNRRYICQLGFELLVIEAATGTILYRNALPASVNVFNMVFNNADSRLYAICASPSWPTPQFDSISVATGILNFIADLPKLSVPQIYTYCIDEAAGKYIFVADSAADSSPCHTENLFVLDVTNGSILNMINYPYAEATGNAAFENLIEFSFDNRRGILYALNWHVLGNPTPLSVTITASPNPACEGSEVVFNAIRGSGFLFPSYQWEVNGNKVGTDSIAYVSSTLATGDIIKCIVANGPVCASSDTARSNPIVMQIIPKPNSSLTISASSGTTICAGDPVTFTATPANINNAPTYQWQINGDNVGNNSNNYTTTSLMNGDVVRCIMDSNITCMTPVFSNAITMSVNAVPTVFAGNDTIIAPGDIVPLLPIVSGTIARYEWTPATALTDPSIKDPVATPDISTTYLLKVTTPEGCQASDKMTITVYRLLQMPNAFTPGSDGWNDVFRIPLSAPQTIKSFTVFNRWGGKVFTTTDGSRGWDGTYKNKLQPAGAYVWQIEYEDLLTRKTILEKGTVILVR